MCDYDYYKKRVHVSDEIALTYEDDQAIQSLWSGGKTAQKGVTYNVPCDLIAAGTVPLPNIRVTVDERSNGGQVVKFEVLLLDKKLPPLDGYATEAGIVKLYTNVGEVATPFCIIPGEDFLGAIADGYLNGKPHKFEERVLRDQASMLSTWYGIQIALLHPETKRCFRGASINDEPQKKDSNKTAGNKRQAHYVKKVYIKRGELKRRIEKGRQRHTLSWYVIGHWRHYKNGKTVFVNGYWKGMLRDAKRNLDEGRDRVVTA